MSPLARPPVYADIVEEHFDELDFLWEHREANVFTPDWTLRQLAEHEDRAEAHLDGLRLAELQGVEFAREKLAAGTPSAATAAALVLWESGDNEARNLVLSQLFTGDPPIREGVRTALRHIVAPELRQPLLQAISAGDPAVAAAAVDILTFQRVAVPPFDHLIGEADPRAASLALGGAGRSRRVHPDDFASAIARPEPEVRLAAYHAAARAGLPDVGACCRAAAARGDMLALGFIGALGDPRDLPMLCAALRQSGPAKVAIGAMGAMGRVESIPTLLELMADEAFGIAATAAYKRITGATDVEGAKPFPPPPVPEGEDEEEALPPDPGKAKEDWKRRQSMLTPDRAWQTGIGMVDGAFPPAFNELPLATRRDLYLRLCARRSAVPDIELEALAVRQRIA